jgi:hypothetical protein
LSVSKGDSAAKDSFGLDLEKAKKSFESNIERVSRRRGVRKRFNSGK